MEVGLGFLDDQRERPGFHEPDSEGHQELFDAGTEVLQVPVPRGTLEYDLQLAAAGPDLQSSYVRDDLGHKAAQLLEYSRPVGQ